MWKYRKIFRKFTPHCQELNSLIPLAEAPLMSYPLLPGHTSISSTAVRHEHTVLAHVHSSLLMIEYVYETYYGWQLQFRGVTGKWRYERSEWISISEWHSGIMVKQIILTYCFIIPFLIYHVTVMERNSYTLTRDYSIWLKCIYLPSRGYWD